MRESFEPKDIKDQFIVDLDFLNKNYVDMMNNRSTDQVISIDNNSKRIHLSTGEIFEYTK